MIQKPQETSPFPILPRVPLFFSYDRVVYMRNTYGPKTISDGTVYGKHDTGGAEQGTTHGPQGKCGAEFFHVELTNRVGFHSKCWD